MKWARSDRRGWGLCGGEEWAGPGLGVRGVVGYKQRDSGLSVVVLFALCPGILHPSTGFLSLLLLPLTLPPEWDSSSVDSRRVLQFISSVLFFVEELRRSQRPC